MTGLAPAASVIVVVIVPEMVEYCANMCGTKVSVTTREPAVPVMIVPKDGSGMEGRIPVPVSWEATVLTADEVAETVVPLGATTKPAVPLPDCCDLIGYGGALLEIVDEVWAPVPSNKLDGDENPTEGPAER